MKQIIKNRIILIVTVLMISNIGCAQTTDNTPAINDEYSENDLSALARYLETAYCPHELSFWTAGDVSSLSKQSVFGKSNTGFGGALGVGYTYFLNKNWGLSSGLEYAFYQGKINLNGFSDNYGIFDMFGNPVVYQTKIDGYGEKQFAGLLNIPLSALYQTNGNQKFYAIAGLKLGLPVYGKYSGSSAVLTASGYYPDYDQTEIWQNDLGYGVFNINENKAKLDLGVSVMGTLETGVKWDVGIGTALYTGIFADYGFNNILKSNHSAKRFIEYNQIEPSKPLVNTACVLADRFSPLAFGIKLKMAFSVGCRDLLNDRRAYKSMQSAQYDDYYDFTPVPADTVQTKIPETLPQPEADTTAIEAERLAYLETAKERRQEYSQSIDVSGIQNTGNYNRGIVALTAEQEFMLDNYMEALSENPLSVIEITGHTCDLGTDELNMRIGRERADLAKDYLVEKGISPSRISTFSKGEAEPLFPNDNEVNRKKNRRLEINIRE